MQRVELLTALEQQLGGEVPRGATGEVYSVRDLVDTILASADRGEGHAAHYGSGLVDDSSASR